MSRVQMVVAARCAVLGGVSAVARLLQVSRRAVEGQGITGGLLFDGELLIQLLDGAPDAVQTLAAQWLAQPLLTQVQVLGVCAPTSVQGTGPWQAGFVEVEVLEDVARAPSADAMVAAFLQALTLADTR
jgi:hypothetical protein